ncbi:non-ribosomal peptide synthetase/type I polyketide synthase [Dolichospermum sp. UHCC 0259]|uniref:non-ribosomal peptide synthetase/type I polyketide synthase n=1 Tax=Dolichospermum sp. UHCC 0259 TaxID=2590010 RepID=UPI00144512AE|nr:non-ribosomal peptide synthetase/type I polyketide synthase [Dolichospermum sp. UHCC 0259]MTJ47693.1 amino acid adenylation domain-containing protein [Dolichospermum sp. UHCC 0259]
MENSMTGFKISSGQKSLYLLQSNNPNFQYISHCAISIRGNLKIAVLKSAIENVIQRHEILRTQFPCLPGMNLPVQVINDFINLSIEESDLTNVDTATQAQQISEILKNPNSVKFDLAKSPLSQISIIHLSLIEHILIINLSSLCADTVSLKNIFQEISKYYNNYVNDVDTDTAEEILQYADFCEYQHQAIAEQETELKNIQAYWQQYNIDPGFNLRLPGEKLPSNQSYFQPRFINWQVDENLQKQIEDIAKNHHTNISQILLTCWHIVLSRLTGRRELVIGYNFDGRTYEELDSAIGLFHKTVPVQLISDKNQPFTEILSEVNQTIELCKSWQDVFDWEKVFSNSGYSPFGFEFMEIHPTNHQNSELEFSLMQIHSYTDKFKLKLAGLLTTKGLKLVIHYDSNFLTETQIHICQQHLENLLKTVLTFPEKAIQELDIISDIENQGLREINDDQSKCFHQLFAERAEKTPEDIAIVYQNQQLTYRELNHRANQLAHYLQKLGVTSEVLVGLCLERSLETVIGILGILKAGGAYVALDPKYPQERIAFIVAETQLSILLTQQNLVSALPKFDGELICIDSDWENIVQASPENPVSAVTLQHLAYVIYTSGSTGKPKGVQIPHGNISNYVHAMSQAFQLNRKDTYLHTASFSFSSSVRQLMVPLSQGATVVIAAIEQIQTPLVLFELIQQRQITIIDLVPSYWRSCTELLENLATEERNQILDNQLRLILSASEPLLSDVPRKWRFDFNQNVSFINMYGQTETTGIVCVYPIPDEYEDKITIVPIGRPIATTEIYILDEHLSPVPVGEVGEIHISGSSLARSYFNRPDLTDEKFIPNPFSDSNGALRYRSESRLYKAGDLARHLPDGTIKFIGRADYQVKIRGQRVELGEIESIIALYPGVKQTIVMGRDVSGDQRLVAYIVPKLVSHQETSQTISIKQLRNYLKEKLPEYMIPSTFLILPAFPLTPTGKIDRRALPAPENFQQELAEIFVAPRNELELQLATIWEQVLGVSSVSINDNFFELGGHSLLAIQVISRITQTLKVNLSLRQLFATPTIESLSTWIESNSNLATQFKIEKIPSVDRKNNIPLSYNQEGLWFLWLLEPNNNAYNMSRSYQITGELDIRAFSQSWANIVQRHELLRTTFRTFNGQAIQVIHEPQKIEVPVIDLQNSPIDERQQIVNQLQQEIIQESFDLTVYPLWRIKIIKLSATESLLLITIHHIIFDDWSWNLLFSKMLAFYSSFLNSETTEIVDLPISYADFSHWQRQCFNDDKFNNLLQYWQEKLAGIEPVLDLPIDKPRAAEISFIGATEAIQLSSSLSKALKEVSQKYGVTLFMTLLAAFEILLYRYSGQTDIVIGSPIAGRNTEEVERLIGFFVNTIVLRTDLEGNPSFIELLARVKETTLGAYEHQDLFFDQLVQKLNPERSLNYHPIFQVMFAWQNTGGRTACSSASRSLELPGLDITRIPQNIKIAKFDLTLELEETDTGIAGFFEYRTDLFDSATIRRMVGHFQTLLAAIATNPQSPIANLPLLTAQEKQQLLLDWNSTTIQYPQYNCIHQLIEQQVERTPNAIAVVWENQELTYQELNTQANQIAHYLRSLGVQPEVKVGICVERSLEMIIGILAILKAGGAYLPLDPAYPPERLEFMLSDAQVPFILTKSALLETLPHHQAQVICLDTDKSIFTQQTSSNPSHQTQSHNLAYIIYTSGSTGKPKGIMIEHRSLINAYLAWEDTYHLSSQTSSHLQMASFSFDVCSGDFVRALCSGAKLVICPRDFLLDPQQLYTLIQQQKIDCAEFVPAVLKNLIQYLEKTNQNLAFMKLLVAGSDSWYLSEYQHIRNFCGQQTRLINSYGVSEATIDTTYFETEIVDLSSDKLTPIGRPFPNNQVYLLDDYNQPVPIGVPGELYIGGAGLARGYLHLPDLTADKFIPHPFADYFPHNLDQRLYKTNDKARYLADGNIEFLGRLDNQVKIRGFRIELGEIESLINQHPQIQESIVIVREDVPGDKRIVAYIVFQSAARISEGEIRDYLSQKLPNHFLPAAYMRLDFLPLTPNGKIDRKALPIPEYKLLSSDNFTAPSTATEKIIATIWSQILGLERISIHDNFFALGGHSLLVVQVINAITQELSREISLRQFFQAATIAELAVIIDSSSENTPIYKMSIVPGQINRNSAVLSFSQQRLWFLEQLEPGRADYHISSSYHCLGDLNISALQQALDTIIARHQVLRTTFTNEDGNPIQIINAARPGELQIFDLQNQPLSAQATEIQQLLSQEVQRPFNFSQDLMLRSCLLQISKTEYILLLVIHHIAADGWSMRILFQELSSLYTAFSQNLPSSLAELPIQYADFAQWQRQYLQGDVLESSINYWKKHLTGAPELLSLPTDRPRPPIQSFKGKAQSFFLPGQITQQLRLLGKEEKSTLFMIMLAAFNTLLSRYTNSQDIVVGTALGNRQHSETQDLIGFFVNTLALRTDVSGNPSFKELLGRVREVIVGSYEYQDLPFEKLIEVLQPRRDLSYAPIFQVMLILNEDILQEKVELNGLNINRWEVEKNAAQFDLTLNVNQMDTEILLQWEYNTDLFDDSTIERINGNFQTLLTNIIANPEKPISELPLLTENEQQQLLVAWNNTQIEYPQNKCIHQLFEEQVERTPNAVAVVFAKAKLTYRELNHQANQLAHYLQSSGVKPESLVGICLERSLEMVIGLLAILKAGAAYVPLDPTYPADRVAYILDNSQAKLLLTTSNLLATLPQNETQFICLDRESAVISQHSESNPESEVKPDNLSYVIYTSGSTGKPKGVQICHQSLVNFISSMQNKPGLNHGDNLLAVTTISFDIHTLEIYLPLTVGASIIVASREMTIDGRQLAKAIQNHAVNVMQATPATWRMLLASEWPGNTNLKVICGGEALPRELANRLLAKVGSLWNVYGPTETTVWSTICEVKADRYFSNEDAPESIGRPIANTQTYILDQSFQPVPIGVIGELYIGGDGVARGYLNRPELNAGSFLNNPFKSNSRIYKTGDLARYLPSGNIEYLGRIDNQVKIRGFRIEIGEIENVLDKHPEVEQGVVVVREDTPGNKQLVAYVVAGQSQPSIPELRQFLKVQLPDYMIPAAFVILEALPLTPNGKVDRRELLRRSQESGVRSQEKEESRKKELGTQGLRPIRSQEEERGSHRLEGELIKIWEEVLEVEPIGIKDNFFEVGGHSLLTAILQSKIAKELGIEISIMDIFQYPNIESLAKYLLNQESALRLRSVSRQRSLTEAKDIAIIGMSGRFPGAENINEFWQNLRDGVESIAPLSDEDVTLRLPGIDPDLLNNPNYIKIAALIPKIDEFDAAFFGYSPREAQFIDPQQRMFLECAWSALENAGYQSDRGHVIGVYGGVASSSYLLNNILQNHDIAQDRWVNSALELQISLGNSKDYLSTRVAYKLNLTGPAINVQTACSTSLVAVHLACQSLLKGECDIALAGAVSLLQQAGYLYEEGMISSPDGHCRTFDAEAKGTLFGDGVGVVVLKPLKRAIADGDYIYATIKGSAINNDGNLKVGYTAPSIDGQAAVIAAAQEDAAIAPETITYIEAHGTGTALGDPIEIAGLTQAFRMKTDKKGYCAIGSVKSNIGHLNTVAGVTGLIKTALALKHQQIPPSLNFERPNPGIDFPNSPFYVNTQLSPWESNDFPRRAGVSSFGFGGTNAHVVLEEWDNAARKSQVNTSTSSVTSQKSKELIVISAKTATALDTATINLTTHLQANPEINLADVAYTLAVGRVGFNHRRILVASDLVDAANTLNTGEKNRVFTNSGTIKPRSVVFMFSGQGSQYVNMARELYETEPYFQEQIDISCEILQPHLGFNLRDVLYPDPEEIATATAKLTQTATTQPALFVIEYAIAQLWIKWGITPTAMIGHSIGEYVAATLAGVFSLEDALALVAARGQLMQSMAPGSMLAVPLPENEVEPLLTGTSLQIAVINSPTNCVVSGTTPAIEAFAQQLAAQGIESRLLQTSHAFHSQMMAEILEPFTEKVKQVRLNPPTIPFVSNVTGTWITDEDATNPSYYAQHLRQAVRFADGVKQFFDHPEQILLEVGPGRTLSTLSKRHPDKPSDQISLTSIRHPQDEYSDVSFILNNLGQMWLAGLEINWSAFYGEGQNYRIPLPTYPFERQRYWIEPTKQTTEIKLDTRKKPNISDWFYIPRWKQFLQIEETKDQSENSSLNTVINQASGSSQEQIEQTLLKIWQKVLGINNITIDDNFFELGGDSLLALYLLTAIEQSLGKRLTLATLFVANTIKQLAVLLRVEEKSDDYSCIVPIQPNGNKPPLFVIHAIWGNILFYRELVSYLPPDQPVYGLQAKGLDGKEEPINSMVEMAANYIQEIRRLQPHGPYFIAGHSFGGAVAFEIAQQIHAQGEKVAIVAILDMEAPRIHDTNSLSVSTSDLILSKLNHFLTLKPIDQLNYVLSRMQFHLTVGKASIFYKLYLRYITRSLPSLRTLNVATANSQALRSYVPSSVYPGKLTLFKATDSQPEHFVQDRECGWDQITHQVEIYEVPGTHTTVMQEPNVKVMAEKLIICLQKAQENSSGNKF